MFARQDGWTLTGRFQCSPAFGEEALNAGETGMAEAPMPEEELFLRSREV